MRRPTDDEIMRALCCGDQCNAGYFPCHRWDYQGELRRINALLDWVSNVAKEKTSADEIRNTG